MVQLLLTAPLAKALGGVVSFLPAELAAQVASHLDPRTASSPSSAPTEANETIPHQLIVQVSHWARKAGRDDAGAYSLTALLRLTDIYAPPLAPRERSPELLAILSALQLAEDKASYARMTSLEGSKITSLLPLTDIHDPSYSGKSARSTAEEWQEVRREVSAIINVGASVFAVGTAVWWVGGGRSYAARLSLAFAGAVAIGVIEAFLYWRFFTRGSRDESSKAKRRAKVLSFDDIEMPLAATKQD